MRKLSHHVEGRRAALASVVLLALGTACVSALEPLALKEVFDSFLSGNSFGQALRPFLLLVGILLSRELLALVQERIFWRARLDINFSLLRATVDRLHSLPLSYHRDQSVGGTMTRIERGISGAMGAFTEVLLQLFPAIVYLCVSIVVMFRIDYRLSLSVLVFAPLPAIIGAFASREQAQREGQLMQRWTRVFARFNEVLTGIVVVKSFVMEEQEKRRFLGGVQEANAIVLRGIARDAKFNALRSTTIATARLVALAFGGALVVQRQITLGTLVAFVAYVGGLFQPLQTLTGMYQTLRRAAVSVQSLLSILEARDALGDTPESREVGRLKGEVEFRNISFAYRNGGSVLNNVSLHVKPGEVVALVGPSGAGKTTLMALLQRLYDPASGQILVDGQDVRELKQSSLRSQIGVVLQEGMLFSDSIRDNIAFGRPGASCAEIEDAARAANAHDFVSQLPDGYDTQAGERGAKLSGGERQRVAIARALLKDAPILILDEATSALDAENEEKVQEALQRLTRGRTTFVIAHRLTTVTSADRIAVIKDGGIAEIGSHDELMARDGYYTSLVKRQMRGFTRPSGRLERPLRRSSRPPRGSERPRARRSVAPLS